MKNVAFLSLSLVALSGTAGLGLSSLHEFNMNVQTAALATPDSIPTESGFVIPDFVPDAHQFTRLDAAPTLVAPTVSEAPAAPVLTAALGDIDIIPEEAEVTTEAKAAPVAAPLAPAVRKAIKAPVKRAVKPRARTTQAPVVVQQAQALTHTPGASTRIDYVIGVYR